jgi:hypothetical protein
MENRQNAELQLAYNFVQFTNRNIFLTGKAGTGKTTFLLNLKKISPKRMIVVAPTGVAAINAGGVTIHSFFQLPFHPHIPIQYVTSENGMNSASPLNGSTFKLSREKVSIIKSLDLLVIDEISMVRADLLDAVDSVLRRHKDRNLPFGGVQLLMIGDLQQLAPIVKEEAWEILEKYYDTVFFFGSLALRQTDYLTIELKHIYRQRDLVFIELLNKIRDNQVDAATLKELNSRFKPAFKAGSDEEYINLTTHNAQAQEINDTRLANLPGKVRSFKAVVRDDFPDYAYPTAYELFLKAGAQVMFVKNDISRNKLYFNGKIGKIERFESDYIIVKCAVDNVSISVEMVEWQNMKYTINPETKEIEEKIIGTFTQYPLKLAWAITIHKSQGLTFDKVIIDARAAFAHGQVYVALSRCRTFEGMVLSTKVEHHGIITDPAVSGFINESEQNQPDEDLLNKSKKVYQRFLLMELFDFNSLLNRASYCLKLLKEHHESILGKSDEKLEKVIYLIRTELIKISEKFNPQLQYLISLHDDAEANISLQERIKKACEFFLEKLSEIMNTLLTIRGVETDNKEIRKLISGSFEKLIQEATVKLACLNACSSGFKIRIYLETKARATLEPLPAKSKQVKSVEDDSGVMQHPVLYNRLKVWRNNMASKRSLPLYMILPQKTMVTLANLLPQTPTELITVKGMGKKKVDQFGSDLLEIINAYCHETGIGSLCS